MSTPHRIDDVRPIARAETWQLAATEYERLLALLRSLTPEEWERPTDCDRWDVRAVALHLLGSAEGDASPLETIHQFRVGLPLNRRIDSHHWVDGVNEVQVRERSHLTGDQIATKLEQVAPKAIRGRRLLPPPLRWTPLPLGPPIGWKPLTYLLRMGFTRDIWMHRVDIARATGREMVLTMEHDGRLVGDIVVEWARRHGEPFRLELTGVAGGIFTQGDGGEELHLDAVEFCRVLSGRGTGTGLLAHTLPL